MTNEIKEIREYISCPQFGDDHYGKWGALRLDQRIKIKQLLDYITNLQEENMRLISENESIKNIKYTVDEAIYKSRITKAIAYINNELLPYGDEWHWDDVFIRDYICDLLTILNPKRK